MAKFVSTAVEIACLVIALASVRAESANYHLVGWINTFVPGAGEIMNGHPGWGASQAGLEVGFFTWGFMLSRRSPITLDGVPEQIPTLKRGARRLTHDIDITKPLFADLYQEIGIKLHMTDVFNAYREAANGRDSRIDKTSTLDLFLAPFNSDYLGDPWVYVPLALVATAVTLDYGNTNGHGVGAVPRLTNGSNTLYALDYAMVYPIGSGAPEEMFYRGFLQNEFYNLIPSPFFSVPMSSLLFGLSHSPDARITAALEGLYLGFLAHKNKGKLGPSIAIHFWADVLAAVAEIALIRKSQGLPYINLAFRF